MLKNTSEKRKNELLNERYLLTEDLSNIEFVLGYTKHNDYLTSFSNQELIRESTKKAIKEKINLIDKELGI